MKLYATVLEYYLQPIECYVFSSKELALAKAKEIHDTRLAGMDLLKRRYYRLYSTEAEEGEDCLAHYKLPN